MSRQLYLTAFLILSLNIFSYGAGGAKKCKCDEDAIANRESKDESWNKYIHEACASIQNKDYNTAYDWLDKALKIGEDSYIKGLFNCIKEMGITGDKNTGKEIPVVTNEPEKAPPVVTTPPAEKKAEPEIVKEVTKPKPTPVTEIEKPAPVPVKPVTEEKTAEKPVAIAAETDEVEIKPKEGSRVFTSEELSSFQAKGILKVDLFKNYLNKIGNKSISTNEGLDAIKNALKLFYGTTYVQVSSVSSSNKPKFPTRSYLERVRALNYDKVEIEWAECQYASNLKKAPDGNYYGYVKFRQRFKGIKDDRVVYEDITDKTIAIILKAYDKAIEGEKVENFDVFLGDIDVVQTMKN